jgi:branched-chain amino acid transport system substrate-binding protein
MKMKKVFALALAVMMVAAMFAGCGAKNYAENNTEFVIGASGPLTGAAAVYGVAVQNSAQMAVDEINAAGGLNGIKFKLVMMDDKDDGANISSN